MKKEICPKKEGLMWNCRSCEKYQECVKEFKSYLKTKGERN